ncbi:MAG TPA: Ohr family peroxiredoxin [Streptosporangiaceae bacterium]|nr:Ohr family peroxiredoxin [Streptosporangiaceae bacterium]
MATVLYTAQAHTTGGREHGHGHTTDGELNVEIRPPKEAGGPGGGTNPEDLVAVGWAAAFESALGTVARRHHLVTSDVSIESDISLLSTGDGGYTIEATLDVMLPSIPDHETAAELIREAERVCPYSSAFRGNIDITYSLDGEPV